MPDKYSSMEALIAMVSTGFLIGMGQLLSSEIHLSPRIIIGRALTSVGISLVAGTALLQIPEIPLLALIGLSALLASLGTSFLEKVIHQKFGVK